MGLEMAFSDSARGATVAPGRAVGASRPTVELPSRREALHRLRYVLERSGGPAFLYGPSGVGKSQLAGQVVRESGARALVLDFPLSAPDDLAVWLDEELAGGPCAGSAPQRWRRVRARLNEGPSTWLVVEDAQGLASSAVWDALAALAKDVPLLVVGLPETWRRLPPALAERLAAHVPLLPLERFEALHYVEKRWGEGRFTAPAFECVYRCSEGLPRRLDRLVEVCDWLAGPDERGGPFGEGRAREAIEVATGGLGLAGRPGAG